MISLRPRRNSTLAVPLFIASTLLSGAHAARADSQEPLALAPQSTLITTHSEAGEGKAAKLLQTYLRTIYEVKDGFDIVAQDKVTSPDGKAILALGHSKWADSAAAKLPRFGYQIRRKANVVVITGSQPDGTLAGALHFLDEFAGVRFYMPGALWTSTPVGRNITLGNIDETSSPYVVGLVMTGLKNVADVDQWSTYNMIPRTIGGATQHNMWEMFPPALYAEKYPEIYPILDGKRYIPTNSRDQYWQPNFAAPQTLEAAKESVARYFKAHPDATYVAMGMQDSGAFDQSPESLALIAEYQKQYPDPKLAKAHAYSHQYYTFMNALAAWMQENEPDKLLMALSYGALRMLPETKLQPNIMVVTVWGIGELDSDKRLVPDANGQSDMDKWLNVAGHIGNHDWLQGNGYLISRSYTGYYSTYFKALKAAGMQDSFQHIEAYPNWGLDGPKYWILNQLMWNPGQDVNALWEKFCDDMFGPASAPMQKYFLKQEKLWVQLDNVDGPERKLFRWNTQFKTSDVSRAMINEARAYIDEATTLATTPEQKQRIELFSKSFRMSEYLYRFAAATQISQAELDEAQKFFEDNIANDPMTLYDVMQTPKYFASVLKTITRGKKIVP